MKKGWICLISTANSSPTNTITTTATFASSLPRQPRPTPPNTLNLTTFNEPMDGKKDCLEKISACEKLSQKLISPNLVQSVRCPSPIVHNVENNVLSPTESQTNFDSTKHSNENTKIEFSRSNKFTMCTSTSSNFHQNISNFNNLSNANSPLLPDVRKIIMDNNSLPQNVKTPPPPPPRWAKPGVSQSQNNFTVTTTVTFNVNQTNDAITSQVIDQKNKISSAGKMIYFARINVESIFKICKKYDIDRLQTPKYKKIIFAHPTGRPCWNLSKRKVVNFFTRLLSPYFLS